MPAKKKEVRTAKKTAASKRAVPIKREAKAAGKPSSQASKITGTEQPVFIDIKDRLTAISDILVSMKRQQERHLVGSGEPENKSQRPIPDSGDITTHPEETDQEKAVPSEHIKRLQKAFSTANERIALLNDEIGKRNDELKRLSLSYDNLKKMHNQHSDETAQLRNELQAKHEVGSSMLEDVGMLKRQLRNSNKHVESVHQRLAESEKKLVQKTMENQLLKEKMSSFSRKMESVSSIKDKEIGEKQKRFDLERHALQMEVERLKTHQAHKDRIFQQKIIDLNRIISGQQRRLADKERQLSLVRDAYGRVGAIIGPADEITADKAPRHATVRKKAAAADKKKPTPPSSLAEPIVQEKESAASESPYSAKNTSILPYKAEDIMHMVRVAADHGDSKESIRDSLVSSGYDPAEVDKAINQVL